MTRYPYATPRWIAACFAGAILWCLFFDAVPVGVAVGVVLFAGLMLARVVDAVCGGGE